MKIKYYKQFVYMGPGLDHRLWKCTPKRFYYHAPWQPTVKWIPYINSAISPIKLDEWFRHVIGTHDLKEISSAEAFAELL